ncbi:hypothetical protein ACFYV5_25625 [Streptomyces sp. NPDC003035]|uniref:hypothetical protein n=1 Tax=Streptomyces sp. NPDC003035 TaxID=3364676 RepID=UPI00369A6872
MDPEWLLHEGKPLATATVLSHPEQLQRLTTACPEAADTAVLAGDPCFDRLLALRDRRPALRRALGVDDGRTLVVLNSTWGRGSLLGSERFPALLRELTGTLPVDEYRLCAVLHPNIWYGHGPGQVRRWLRRAADAGLTLIDPLGPWRQTLAAADCVIGDHGSVTFYAAALGLPVLLGAFPHEELDPASPVAALGRTAPHLRSGEPLRARLESVREAHTPGRHDGLAAQTTSAPGASAGLLRTLFHDLLRLPEPEEPARLEPLGIPDGLTSAVSVPLRVLTSVREPSSSVPEIAVTRYASPDSEPELPPADDAHTVVDDATRETDRLALADLVVERSPAPPGPRAAELLRERPHATLAVVVTGRDGCLVRTREGANLVLTARPGPDGFPDPCDPAVYASALHAWRESGRPLGALADGMTVMTGGTRHRVDVRNGDCRIDPDGPVGQGGPTGQGGPAGPVSSVGS